MIAATTITGDTPSGSTNVDYRLDTQSARSFRAYYLSLPLATLHHRGDRGQGSPESGRRSTRLSTR
jgi:hypothetical protein